MGHRQSNQFSRHGKHGHAVTNTDQQPDQKPAGISMVELIVVVAIVSVIVVASASFFSRTMSFYKRVRVRQQLVLQSRSCMDTMLQILRYGKAKSVVISTPNQTPMVPNSRIDFNLQDPLPNGTTAYSFYLSSGTACAAWAGRIPIACASSA